VIKSANGAVVTTDPLVAWAAAIRGTIPPLGQPNKCANLGRREKELQTRTSLKSGIKRTVKQAHR
jgi:hypothetical protein